MLVGPHPHSLSLAPSRSLGPQALLARASPSSELIPSDGLLGEINVYLLDVEIFLDAPGAELAADAALFVSAPGRLHVRRLHVVHPDDAGVQVLHGAHGAEDVARPYRGGETVVRVVGDRQGVLFVVEWDDAGHRSEDFFASDPKRVIDIVEDRRLDEKAAVESASGRPPASARDLRFLLADFLIPPDAVELLAADERPHLRVALQPGAELDLPRFVDHRVHELLVDRPLHENAAACRADFALVDEDAEERPVYRRLEIGVGEEDIGRLAAELEGDLLQRAGGAAHDDLPNLDAAGERDFINVCVLDERGARGFAGAGDDVDHAWRQTGVSEARCELEHCNGRLLGRFEDCGAAGADRGGKLPRGHHQRVVPRDDLSGDTDRLAQGQAHGVVGHRQHLAVNLRREAPVILETGRDIGDVELGLGYRLAAVPGLELGQL